MKNAKKRPDRATESFLAAVDRIYEAALDDAHWAAALENMGELLQARSGSLVVIDLEFDHLGFHKFFNFSDSHLKAYEDYYLGISPYRHLLASHPVDGLVASQRHFSDRDLVRTEYHHDFERQEGYRHHAAVFLRRDDSRVVMLDFQRAIELGHYQPEQLSTLERLVPHVRRALQLNRRLWELGREKDAATDVLGRLSLGVILIDEDERACYANPRAEAILRAGDGLRKAHGRLAAALPAEAGALERLIHEAVLTGKGVATHAGGWLHLAGTGHGQPLALMVSPLPRRRMELGPTTGGACAAVLVTAREQGPPPLDEMLRALYGLTAAEARLATALAEGWELTEVAERFRISRETARTQLRTVFEKTGTHRQAALVKLLLSTPAAFLKEA